MPDPNPWLQWFEALQGWLRLLTTSTLQAQLIAFGLVLVAAFILDRALERFKSRWVKSRLRTIFWTAKFPILVLICGYLALVIYSLWDRPVFALIRLVTLFWFITAYALIATAVTVMLPPGQGRHIIRRVLLPLLAVLGSLHLVGLLNALWKWAGQTAIHLGSGTISGTNIGLAVIVVALFWLAARGGRAVFLYTVLPRVETDRDLARSAADFIQFAVIVVGLWLAVAALGIRMSNLTLLISALTVGIGFGLQDVIKNLMGGLILLGEKHVRPNDVFQIAGESGIVERIGLRSTVLRTWDGARVIIPNEDLITEKVSNLSGVRRIQINVGASNQADPRLVERLLGEVVTSHPQVLADPAPVVMFERFGENTFDFAVYCWVAERSELPATKSDLHYAIVEAFAGHGIQMPHRQIEVRLRSQEQEAES